MNNNKFRRESSLKQFNVWLNDGSLLVVEARNNREAIQIACRKYFLSDTDIDVTEEIIDSKED